MDATINPLSIVGQVTNPIVTNSGAHSTGFLAIIDASTAKTPDEIALEGPVSAAVAEDPRAAMIDGLGILQRRALSIDAQVSDDAVIEDRAPNPAQVLEQGANTKLPQDLTGALASLIARFDRETGLGLIVALKAGTSPPLADGFMKEDDSTLDRSEASSVEIKAFVAVIGIVERAVLALQQSASAVAEPSAANSLLEIQSVGGTTLANVAPPVLGVGQGNPKDVGTALAGVSLAATVEIPDGPVPKQGWVPPAKAVASMHNVAGAAAGTPFPSSYSFSASSMKTISLFVAPDLDLGLHAAANRLRPEALTKGRADGNLGRFETSLFSMPTAENTEDPAAAYNIAEKTQTRRVGTVAETADPAAQATRSPLPQKALTAAHTATVIEDVAKAGTVPRGARQGLFQVTETMALPETEVPGQSRVAPRATKPGAQGPRQDAAAFAERSARSVAPPKVLSAAHTAPVVEEVVRAGTLQRDALPGSLRELGFVTPLVVEDALQQASGAVSRSAEVGMKIGETPLAPVSDPRLASLSPPTSPGGPDGVTTLLSQVVAQAGRFMEVERGRNADATPVHLTEVSPPPLPEFLARALPANGGPGHNQAVSGVAPDQTRFATVLASQIRAAEISEGRTLIELSPRGLGRIEVDIQTDSDGSLKVTIRAENTAVLNTLRDARDLLAPSIGVASGGALDFQEGSLGQDRGRQNDVRTPGFSGDEDTAAELETPSDVIGDGQLDIMT